MSLPEFIHVHETRSFQVINIQGSEFHSITLRERIMNSELSGRVSSWLEQRHIASLITNKFENEKVVACNKIHVGNKLI